MHTAERRHWRLPGAFSLPAPRINASKDNTFDDSLDVVFTGDRLIKLDDNYRRLVGLPTSVPTSGKATLAVDFQKVIKAVLTLAEALVSNSWTDTPTKWTQAGLFKVAAGLADIFAPTVPGKTLTIDDVKVAVQSVVDENEARTLAPDVVDLATWLNLYVEKSSLLAKGSPNPSTVELTDYDRNQFLEELNDRVDGKTPFLSSMGKLRDNRAIRKHVIPTYLMGVILHLHLEILNLAVKRASTPLDVADINALLGKANRYVNTLSELEQDYVSFCKALANQYPLMGTLDQIGRTDLSIVYAEPMPKEAIALAQGAITKWLQGDRMVIATTAEKLTAFISKVEKMPVV